MEWLVLLGFLFLFLCFFGLEYLFYSTSKKEQADDAYITRTHAPKRRTIVTFVMTILLFSTFLISSLVFIFSDIELGVGGWIAFVWGGLFAVSIPSLLLLICIADYEVITKNGILVHRLHKKRLVTYDQIACYTYTLDQLTVYGKHGEVVFFVADNRVGLQALIKELQARQIPKK